MSEEENAKSAEKGKKTVKEEPKMSEDELRQWLDISNKIQSIKFDNGRIP